MRGGSATGCICVTDRISGRLFRGTLPIRTRAWLNTLVRRAVDGEMAIVEVSRVLDRDIREEATVFAQTHLCSVEAAAHDVLRRHVDGVAAEFQSSLDRIDAAMASPSMREEQW